jgi:Ca2+-binding EF-hand superfamily protein
MVWKKIEEKFQKLNAAFRFFDRDNQGHFGYNEFCYGLDKIGLKLTSEDLRKVFKHIDLSGDGKINFNKFIQLSEENRIDLNPYSSFT